MHQPKWHEREEPGDWQLFRQRLDFEGGHTSLNAMQGSNTRFVAHSNLGVFYPTTHFIWFKECKRDRQRDNKDSETLPNNPLEIPMKLLHVTMDFVIQQEKLLFVDASTPSLCQKPFKQPVPKEIYVLRRLQLFTFPFYAFPLFWIHSFSGAQIVRLEEKLVPGQPKLTILSASKEFIKKEVHRIF